MSQPGVETASYYAGRPLTVDRDGELIRIETGTRIFDALDWKHLGSLIRGGVVLVVGADGVAPEESMAGLTRLGIPAKTRRTIAWEERARRRELAATACSPERAAGDPDPSDEACEAAADAVEDATGYRPETRVDARTDPSGRRRRKLGASPAQLE